MPNGSWDAQKEQVRQATDIVDLIGSYLPLRREGRGYKALCPWHDDSRPSLQVNGERQSFKCWVCDVGGDAFSFVMKIEGVEFPQAMQMLAQRAGIVLDRSSDGSRPNDAEDKQTLYQAMAWAEQEYHKCLLHAPEAAAAREYLHSRGIHAASLQKFRLGYSPDRWDWIVHQARDTRFTARVLESVGLIVRRSASDGHYDRFRRRVLFPIHDPQARPVGMGGRILPGDDERPGAKYVNSPETPLFSKSSLLYGLDHARKPIRAKQSVLVMEGYTDCIVAHQQGFEHAVAVLGTALGEKHIRLLRQIEERLRVVLVLDGDEAGRRRAKEVLELFVAQQVDLRVLTLPGEKDPCDYLLADGAEAFERAILGAPDAIEHAMQAALSQVDLERDVHGASAALDQVLAMMASAPRLRDDSTADDRLREERLLQRVASLFRASESFVRSRLTEQRKRKARGPYSSRHAPRGVSAVEPRDAETPIAASQSSAAPLAVSIDPWERELLELLLQHPAGIATAIVVVSEAELSPGPCRELFLVLEDLWAAGHEPTWDLLLSSVPDPGLQSFLVGLDECGRSKSTENAEQRLEECLASFQQRRSRRETSTASAALKQGRMDEQGGRLLLMEIIERERNRQGISAPTDG